MGFGVSVDELVTKWKFWESEVLDDKAATFP